MLFILTEVNTFYLKYVLWVPAGHIIVLIRLQIFIFWGAVAVRELYDYCNGEAQTIGQQFWVYSACLFCECLIIYKFGKDTVTIPPSPFICKCWISGFAILVLWTIWNFQVSSGNVTPGSEEEKEAIISGDIDPKAALPRLSVSGSPGPASEADDSTCNLVEKSTPNQVNLRKRKV